MGNSLGLQTIGYPIRRGRPRGLLLNGLVGAWGFNEASGSALDAGPNGLHLTANNAPGAGTGLIGGDRTLVKASSQYFSLADQTLLRAFRGGQIGFTFAGWFFPTVNSGVRCYASKDDGGATTREWFLGRTTATACILEYYNGSTGATVCSFTLADTTSGWALNQWNFLAARWDGGTGATLNVNGSKTTAVMSGAANTGGTAPFRIGSQAPVNLFFVDGSLDSSAMWNYALSDADLATFFALRKEYPYA